MRYPAYVAEMAAPANRQKLWYGIWSGFAVAVGFGVLALAAAQLELSPWRSTYLVLVLLKLGTNSLALISLVKDRWVLAMQAVNSISDVVLLTAAIYFTGGAYS
ncbi:MAG: Two-component hybrid sensor and regulator, partial [Deltaproteobacteria bacterium]|nr:Two-component hybrid sensor and regulator [Deltaproteobacteria bacterium]